LIGAIESSIPTPERDEKKNTVMHVLRSFDVNKPGTKIKDIKGGVIGGSIVQGTFQVGDEIEIKPGLANEKTGKYEPIFTQIASLGTGAGIVKEVKSGGLIAIATKLDPTMTRSDSLIGSVIGKPGTLPENSYSTKIEVNLFDTAVGSGEEIKVSPITTGESLRLSLGTAPLLSKVTSVRGKTVELQFKRPVCIFDNSKVAISRRIAERWRLIGAGVASG